MSKKLKSLLKEQFNITHYIYYFCDRSLNISPVIHSSGIGDTIANYYKKGELNIEPTITYARVFLKPVVWSLHEEELVIGKKAFFKFLDKLNIIDCVTLNKQDNYGNVSILNLYIDKNKPEKLDEILDQLDSLQMQLIHFHQDYLVDKQHVQFLRNQLYLCLSEKERNIMLHVSEGNTYKMIEEKLSIKERTIKSNIKKICEKVGAKNTKEALMKLHSLSII
ncbi:LuxR C-terminal-related transcriptional regulator [Orbaceae bacterium ac157xtp]